MSDDTENETEFPTNYDPKTGVYTLLHPFEGEGQTHKEIELRRFRVKDLKAAHRKKDGVDRNVQYLLSSTRLAPGDLDEMDAEDSRLIMDIVHTFL